VLQKKPHKVYGTIISQPYVKESCGFQQNVRAYPRIITACAVTTSCCIRDVPSRWEDQNFDPPLLPHFSTDFNETKNQERYPGYDPTCKIWLMWDDKKGVWVWMAFYVTFCVLFFWYSCSRLQVTPEDRSRPFMAQNACFHVRYPLL